MLFTMKSNLIHLFLVAFVLLSRTGAYGNNLPVLSNIRSTYVSCDSVLLLTYDVADSDNQFLTISIQLFNEAGKKIPAHFYQYSGDVGFQVAQGTQKKIEIRFLRLSGNECDKFKIKIIVDDNFISSPDDIINGISKKELTNNLHWISGIRDRHSVQGISKLKWVRDSLVKFLTALDYQVYLQDTVVEGKFCRNIIAEKKGLLSEDSVFVLCAHYDAVAGSPGADDNASGVAGLLEIAKTLSSFKFAKTIRLIAFDMEEEAALGSRIYCSRLAGDTNEHIIGVINFDMIGYFSNEVASQQVVEDFAELFPVAYKQLSVDGFRGNFILAVSNELSANCAERFERLAKKYVLGLNVIHIIAKGKLKDVAGLGNGDHGSFWKYNYPALYIGDGTFTRNTDYHSPGDIPENINYDFMTNVVRATALTIADFCIFKNGDALTVGFLGSQK
jgi:Peptidase family M28